MKPLLDIQNLTIHFSGEQGEIPALRQVSLRVNRGEILALVGESGSGKSVTSLSILRLLPTPPAVFKQGQILYSPDGEKQTDLLKESAAAMQQLRGNHISMIFQEPMTSLNPVYTCGQQVAEALRLHKNLSAQEARGQTLYWFERVKLPNPAAIYDRFPHQLSGGQKQRVMIAMAMCCHPSLLICDEPTTALDVTVQKTILQLIRELQQESGMGVIFITHDLGVVAEVADRAAVMYRGEIVESGPVRELFTNPSHPYTQALLACRPVNHPRGKRLPVVSDFMGNEKQPQPIVIDNLPEQKAAAPEPLLKVEDLSVWFPIKKSFWGKPLQFTRAVDEVSFDVYKGETLGLVGESGCGKTTLGRTLLRLIEPTSGKIFYNGEELTARSGKSLQSMRRDIQIIFQDPYSSLNPRLTIGSAIAEPMRVHGIGNSDKDRRGKVIDLLEKVNLKAEHYNRYPHEFSGGQRQRIVIARALGLNPSFIICDESVSALDVSVQAQVLNLLNDLKKEYGFTVIFISHDLSVVRYISDRILVMNRGRIEEIGNADDVYLSPQSSYTRQLIASIPKGLPAI
ncbi:MAG: ABC transporter ATP-binding protein [Sphingobacteriales bacterium SCN 48-20]|uniref:ABC transporter ATP-binding protein n=1 Tax=Terrimonas ferruginea TaxID=249 RepID=UPI00086E6E11|nr:ABC transporter ATP-binding protein [Terrimonas ferruginea]MBN8784801.1 ABC transporter ATP-binding protein [Terrimonas ferruginea]ODT94944.1 MAG: ABC transporter ATP-binding protein [Sphingobacteriales bacterium SCN 48-20]OJW45362.1 MAG: ABC transporter ATP-binding protein [Sphingobacteriales bacterium 48-107]